MENDLNFYQTLYDSGMSLNAICRDYPKAKRFYLQKHLKFRSMGKAVSLQKTGTQLSKSHKEAISNGRKRFLEENPDKVPFLLNHSSKVSFPEKYFMECFTGLDYAFQHPVFRYKLDFANAKEKLYFEVDGEQHFSAKMIEHDQKRTEKLTSLGWIGIRVRWSEFQKLSHEEKKSKVEEIISSMKWNALFV